MPKSLLVFAVSYTPETANFGTFGEEFLNFFLMFAPKVCICTYLNYKLWKKLIVKKNQGAEPPQINVEFSLFWIFHTRVN